MPGWILQSRDEPPITLRLPPGSIKTIGRTARADFIVDAALVSRLHCRLTADRSDQLQSPSRRSWENPPPVRERRR